MMRSEGCTRLIYDDGHLIELAVFETANVPSLSVNDYRVLVDKSDLTARLAGLKRDTTLRAAEIDATGSRRFRQIVVQVIVGPAGTPVASRCRPTSGSAVRPSPIC